MILELLWKFQFLSHAMTRPTIKLTTDHWLPATLTAVSYC